MEEAVAAEEGGAHQEEVPGLADEAGVNEARGLVRRQELESERKAIASIPQSRTCIPVVRV
jgi:hypothetical protein